jgi:hypothetical protein
VVSHFDVDHSDGFSPEEAEAFKVVGPKWLAGQE